MRPCPAAAGKRGQSLVDRPPVEPVDAQPAGARSRSSSRRSATSPATGEQVVEQVGHPSGDHGQAVALTQFQERPRPAAVLRWASPPPANADRVAPAGFGRDELLDPDVVAPAVDEVVVVDEPFPDAQAEAGQRDPPGVVAETDTAGVGDAVLAAVDDEAVQVLVGPAEGGLQDRVQVGNCGRRFRTCGELNCQVFTATRCSSLAGRCRCGSAGSKVLAHCGTDHFGDACMFRCRPQQQITL